ncbi:MAG: multidrug efflux SMR transporter [bacterium]|nr:multidrug efflux SMR transporter [bacterium]
MAWIYLLIAGIFEIGWPLGIKLSQTTEKKVFWIIFAAVTMIASGFFLWLSQKEIPMGTAYVIWTGIGAIGALTLGVIKFDEPVTFWRMFSAMLIIGGVVGLKISHN